MLGEGAVSCGGGVRLTSRAPAARHGSRGGRCMKAELAKTPVQPPANVGGRIRRSARTVRLDTAGPQHYRKGQPGHDSFINLPVAAHRRLICDVITDTPRQRLRRRRLVDGAGLTHEACASSCSRTPYLSLNLNIAESSIHHDRRKRGFTG